MLDYIPNLDTNLKELLGSLSLTAETAEKELLADLLQSLGAVNENGNTSQNSIQDRQRICGCFGITMQDLHEAEQISCIQDNFKPDIKLIISDLDNTIVDAYSGAADLFIELEKYIAKSTNQTFAKVHKRLKNEVNKSTSFGSSDLFSMDGYKKILRASKVWKKEIPLDSTTEQLFKEGFSKSYAKAYPGVIETFKKLNNIGIPIVIHSDAPLEQAIDKLLQCGLISLAEDKDGNIISASSLISGISASSRPGGKTKEEQIESDKRTQQIITALNKIGVFVNKYPQEQEKPSPIPLRHILNIQKNRNISPKNILMLGDSLPKDGGFAWDSGINFAWMLKGARASDKVRHLEHASNNNRHAMSYQLQIKFFCRDHKLSNEFGNSALKDETLKALATITNLCVSSEDLFRKYNFYVSNNKTNCL